MLKKVILAGAALAVTSGLAVAAVTSFSDVPSDHWAASAITWNNANGIMTGPGEMPGMFDPAGHVNRAQLATVNQRMYDKMEAKTKALESKISMLEAKLNGMSETEKEEEKEEQKEEMQTIAELASAKAMLSTLVAALEAAELVETFADEEGSYTVFAPTNAAFAEIQEKVDELLKEENKEELQNVLKFHVVAGKVKAADLSDGQMITTLQGEQLEVSISNGTVMIGEATVTTADVHASNGVIHIIDTVLLPSSN